ncbi:hypothetical protein E2C01_100914 [Portunus trituberculatus]|uniref:Uncharacterized protein n=1 Tax=Portunus trituberculatus TaxID=210409 RepID=A0A5B7K989_PORTR|nr:hypothetical protein [Portunus trituberculatus]
MRPDTIYISRGKDMMKNKTSPNNGPGKTFQMSSDTLRANNHLPHSHSASEPSIKTVLCYRPKSR